ncbi:HAD family hydrolase [Aliikangiella maris]|uniref:HAD-IA family hydrolase n=2 Tax=Aliikangiella maris TaxID=3162458 RepID=A0ABV3MI59_9GAMM
MIKAVFFDFDGTLADTAPDLGFAINQVLQNHKHPTLPYETIRPHVSGGSPALIKLGFNIDADHPSFAQLKQEFLQSYEKAMLAKSKLFAGIRESLNFLNQKQVVWGIITNKPDYLTQPIVAHFNLINQAQVIISGDTYPLKKPDPYPLIQACKICNVAVEESIYVGDDERDIIAAKAANMQSVCANWGYQANKDSVDWQADYYLQESIDLKPFLSQLLN